MDQVSNWVANLLPFSFSLFPKWLSRKQSPLIVLVHLVIRPFQAHFRTYSTLVCLLFFYSTPSHATYKDDIEYTRLLLELGVSTPAGNGVLVSHVEAPTSVNVYLPDPANAQLLGDTITDVTGISAGTYSGHATGVGSLFYGSSSMASGINLIDAYEANYWLQPNFLRFGGSLKPLSSSSRVANHSWVGNLVAAADNSNMLRRTDWVIETDEFIQAVGTNNGVGVNSNLLGGAYNVIAVGRTDGVHGTSTRALDADYTAGRTKPEVVAPLTVTSTATPLVAATAAVLVETGHSNPGLSTDLNQTSTTNRNGATIYNAERSEVIKAAIMAGANRLTINGAGVANISDYRVAPANQSANGLDVRFGAGQVNIYNSYHIIAAGEQNSNEDDGAGSGAIGIYGFDYDPFFGGSGSNSVASYFFSSGASPVILTASLVWNIDIAGGNGQTFTSAATLRDIDLYLYDVTGAQSLLVSSTSSVDNTENIWTPLSAGRNYLLRVVPKAGQAAFSWDYALAWQIVTDTDGDGVSDTQDNCPVTSNANQADLDGDKIGDVCDGDIDGDGFLNGVDAFPLNPAEWLDTDGDGTGNNADTDDDNDGLLDTAEIALGTNPLLFDTDGDGYGDGYEVTVGSNPLNINSVPASGDLNADGIVNIVDVMMGQQILSGQLVLTAALRAHGDVAPLIAGVPSPNGVFNAGDLVVIQRKAMGAITF